MVEGRGKRERYRKPSGLFPERLLKGVPEENKWVGDGMKTSVKKTEEKNEGVVQGYGTRWQRKEEKGGIEAQ